MVAFLTDLRIEIKRAVQSVLPAKIDYLVTGMSAGTFWGGKTAPQSSSASWVISLVD
jgi:hypothetical protein